MFIDISKHNANDIKDWQAIKNSVEGIMIRCGYRGYGSGKIVADPQYDNYAKMCIKHNIPFGVYFMSQAITISEGMEEAEYAVKSALRHSATIPLIIIDSEDGDGTGKIVRADGLSQNDRTEICKAFCEKANELGFVGGVYASESWFKNRLHYDSLKHFYIWCAKYGVNDGKQHTKPDLEKVDMWQYSSHGKCEGISDRVDVNVMCTKPERKPVGNIKTYSLLKDGNNNISTNFKVREFRCKDGSDTIKICSIMLGYLQKARSHFGCPIYINSGYRTEAHNRKVGGASSSYHLKGQACDHHTKGKIDLYEMARYYESLGCKGIIVYPNSGFIHIDSRESKYFAIDYGNKITKVDSFKNVKKIPSLKGYKGFSIVQGLKNFGYESSFEYRTELWKMIGKTAKYKGTATQNLTLLNYLKSH